MSETVALTREGRLAFVTLNAPPLNLVSVEMTHALNDVFASLASDDTVRCLVLSGAGEKAFCAGSDIAEFDDYMRPHAGVTEKLWVENAMYTRLAEFPWPTIAMVKGVAFGGGLELAVCCDLIYAARSARFALPEVRLGVFPGSGGTVRVTERIGPARAKRMMFFGDPIDAATAAQWGLVDELADDEALADTVQRDGERLAGGPQSLRLMKSAIALARDHAPGDAITRTLPLIDEAFNTADCREGVSAFRQKRPPRF